MGSKKDLIVNNWTYLLWLAFYAIIFERLLYPVIGEIVLFRFIWHFPVLPPFIILGALLFLIALTTYMLFEPLWRILNGVRPLRLDKEKDRLRPLFAEVYKKVHYEVPHGVRLYIQEDMDINAFAFGRETLAITKGSVMLLSDDELKGLIAHELGHFANDDTVISMLTSVCVLPFTLIMMLLGRIKSKLDIASKKSFILWVFKGFFDLFYYFFRGIQFVSEILTMHQRRKSEYLADEFAVKCGYGEHLAEALNNLYEVSISGKQTVKEMMMSTHPHITKRIERLEEDLKYQKK